MQMIALNAQAHRMSGFKKNQLYLCLGSLNEHQFCILAFAQNALNYHCIICRHFLLICKSKLIR